MSAKHLTLTIERIREVLDYDPETGIFTWKVARGKASPGKRAGSYGPEGYFYIKIDGVICRAGRLAFFHVHGRWPEQIDHVNRVVDDDRLANLREATLLQNLRNRRTMRNNKSGFKGVFKWKCGWRSVIMVSLKQELLGFFETPQEAARAYDRRAIELFGEFAFLNFPEEA